MSRNLISPTGTVHAATRGVNPYSGEPSPAPLCNPRGDRSRHLYPTDAPVTCKRCAAKLAARAERMRVVAELRSPEMAELIADGLRGDDAPATPEQSTPEPCRDCGDEDW